MDETLRHSALAIRWQIVSAQGVDLGIYEGETEQDALDALARDAGYKDWAEAAEVGDDFRGTVKRIDDSR